MKLTHPALVNLTQRFDALNQRERISVALLLLVGITVLFYVLLIEPLMLQADKTDKQIVDLQAQVDSGQKQISAMQKTLSQDPDAESRQQLARLQQQQQRIDEQLRGKMQGLIEPAQMAEVLEAVLTKTSRLRLEKLKNLPTRPLMESVGTDEGAPVIADVGVYRHGLQIELRGSYLNMLDYLKTLNALPWDFYWDSLELQVQAYPDSHIVIVVHTLSFREGWIGV